MSGQSTGDTEQKRLIECQFCDAVHESTNEHEEHVERMHYAELLRSADTDSDRSGGDLSE